MNLVSKILALAAALPLGLSTKNDLAPEVKAFRDEILAAIKGYKEVLVGELNALKAKSWASPEEVKALSEKLEARIDALEAEMKRSWGPGSDTKLPSIGALVTEHPEFKRIAADGRGRLSLDLKGKSLWEYKTLIDSTAVGSSTPGILIPQRVGGIIANMDRDLRIRDLLAQGTTQNNAVEYVKENVFTNAASPQTEGSSKAESALTFTIASANVRTIAHWIPATKQILADFAGLRSFIDMRLMYGLKLKEETELLSGDGLGDHISGVITNATAYDTTLNVANDSKLDKLRHAIYQAELAGFPVDGIVLHPKDAHDIELIKTAEGGTANFGSYVVGNPNSGGGSTPIWGVPRVKSLSMTSGKFLVGAFSLGAQLFDRQEAVIDVSESHSTYFVENKIAIRCEERLALAIYRAGAFIYGSF